MEQPLISLFSFEIIYVARSVKIGLAGVWPISWPHRSTDLTPLEFFCVPLCILGLIEA